MQSSFSRGYPVSGQFLLISLSGPNYNVSEIQTHINKDNKGSSHLKPLFVKGRHKKTSQEVEQAVAELGLIQVIVNGLL